MDGNPTWFPAFKNLFRKNDVYENYEAQTNQGAGLFFRWLWEDSKSEIYGELHYNDSKQNIRDLKALEFKIETAEEGLYD